MGDREARKGRQQRHATEEMTAVSSVENEDAHMTDWLSRSMVCKNTGAKEVKGQKSTKSET